MGAVGLRTLASLRELIQEYSSVQDLEGIFDEVFGTDEATPAEIRLKKGKYGPFFKIAAEELWPLIQWLKIRHPKAKAKLVIGNQNYDAKVDLGSGEIFRVEIGLAIDGHQNSLLMEKIGRDGHGSPNSTYERVSSGATKSVKTTNPRTLVPVSAKVSDSVEKIRKIAVKKCAKSYDPLTRLVLFLEEDFGIRGQNLENLTMQTSSLLKTFAWKVQQVDVIGDKCGLLGGWTRLD